MEKQKICENCVHFLTHYVKDGIHLSRTFQGHCTNRKPSGHFRKTDNICEFYVEKDLEKEKQKALLSTTKYLARIEEELVELNEVLKLYIVD